MKKIFTALLLAGLAVRAPAQSFAWIDDDPVNFSQNPYMTNFGLELDESHGRLYTLHLDAGHQNFNLVVYGEVTLEARDLSGNLVWDLPMGNKVSVPMIETNGQGDVYVAGGFMDTLFFSPAQFMVNTGSGFDIDYFIAKFDATGNLLWSRNLSNTWTNVLTMSLQDIESDPNGDIWYALSTLTGNKHLGHFTKIDAAGNDLQTRTIENIITIGAISFDPWGGLYVSGDASSGNFVMGTDTFTAPYTYNIYLARYGADGQPQWATFGSTVTIIKSQVVADAFGNAYLSGPRYDSLSFGKVHLGPPTWLEGLYLFKTDSLADFKWGVPPPPTPGLPLGEFSFAPGWYSGTDNTGAFYIGGAQRGTLDWGNNIVAQTSSGANRLSCFVKVSPTGQVQWVKLAGHNAFNITQAMQVGATGDCYFTSFADDSAFFDNFFVQTGALRNYIVGKLAPAPTGINTLSAATDMRVGPNPSDGWLLLPESMRGGSLQVYDTRGRIVYRVDEVKTLRYNLRHLRDGLYLLIGGTPDHALRARWIKTE
jgi:hypothetical protein